MLVFEVNVFPDEFYNRFAIPDAILEDQAQTFSIIPGIDPVTKTPQTITRYVINTNDSDRTYNFGPTYGIRLTERLSLGTTIYSKACRSASQSNQVQPCR